MVFTSWLALNLALIWFSSTMGSVVVDSWKKGPLIDPAAPYAPENAQMYLMWIALWTLNTYFLGLFFSVRLNKGWIKSFAPLVVFFLSFTSAEIGMQWYLATNQTTHFRPHPTLHWMCRPNLQSFESSSDGIILNTNQHGMREAQAEYAKSEGVEVFNPAEMFTHHTPEELLMDEGKDLNHYAKDKLHIVGDIQLERILHVLG